jgi:hypothetical protein
MNQFKLTKDNYFSPSASKRYMSVSQYKSFLECEDQTMAIINGEYEHETSPAFLEGLYLHAWSEGKLEEFKKNTPALYDGRKKEATLKKAFVEIDSVLELLEMDPDVTKILQGEKEVIVTSELFGVEWKGMFDIYNPQRKYIVDLKYMADLFKSFYKNDGVNIAICNFVEYYRYDIQMVIYAELERIINKRENPISTYMLAISKGAAPIKLLLYGFLDNRIKILSEVERNLEHIMKVKNKQIEPTSCGKCKYCLQKKNINSMHYTKIPLN